MYAKTKSVVSIKNKS